MGRYKETFAYDGYSDEELAVELRSALARLDLLNNGDALRLRDNADLAILNQLSKKKRASLRLETMEAVAGLREETRRRGTLPQ